MADREDRLGERVAHSLDIFRVRCGGIDPIDKAVQSSQPGEGDDIKCGGRHFFGDLIQLLHAPPGDAGGRALGHDLNGDAGILEREDAVSLHAVREERAGDRLPDYERHDRVSGQPGRGVGVDGRRESEVG